MNGLCHMNLVFDQHGITSPGIIAVASAPPGYMAKRAEKIKFDLYPHINFVPFALETTGRPGYHAKKFIRSFMSDADQPSLAFRDTWSVIQSVLHSAISKQQFRFLTLCFLQPFAASVCPFTHLHGHSCLTRGNTRLQSGSPGGRHRGRSIVVGSQRWAPNVLPSRSPGLTHLSTPPASTDSSGTPLASADSSGTPFHTHTVVSTGSLGSLSCGPGFFSADESGNQAGEVPHVHGFFSFQFAIAHKKYRPSGNTHPPHAAAQCAPHVTARHPPP